MFLGECGDKRLRFPPTAETSSADKLNFCGALRVDCCAIRVSLAHWLSARLTDNAHTTIYQLVKSIGRP